MNKLTLGEASTYQSDLDLFKELGFKPFTTDSQDEIFVGEYKLPFYDNASIKVWVSCMPAQFWRFEIETDEEGRFKMETGSGSLKNYWSTAMMVAEGMLVINKI